ncbi:glycosyltransferase family 4 protein [Mucilaginibacter calamicampi]|uniref:Glycosyltransferase family 4 protein n=1 Tax=Mucilaginibacter calamicampi TaxID=1302352 RepID=A0ABW2Z0T0_9SPHI
MRILLLSHRVPFPQNGGYSIVVCNTIRGLLRMGHEVSVLALNAKPGFDDCLPDDDLLGKISYRSHRINTAVTVLQVATNLLQKTSFNIDRYYDEGFEQLVINEVKTNRFDIIQFEGLLTTLYYDAARKNSNAQLIYRAHNIENQLWERLSQQKIDPFKRSYLKMHARRIKNYELHQLNQFDALLVFTNEDKNTLVGDGIKVKIQVLPIGIRLDQYKPDRSLTEFPSLFFLGSLDWLPNREGMEWFLQNFHNVIANGELMTRLYVAGNDIPDAFDDYEALGKIFIQGEVDNALEFVNSKAIMIVPLLTSGGMRVKIVEGMAMQKCIISTSLGAEGINYVNGRDILIANTAEEFYKAIKRCISDEEFCHQVGANARKLIEAEYDITLITQKLVDFYHKCLQS